MVFLKFKTTYHKNVFCVFKKYPFFTCFWFHLPIYLLIYFDAVNVLRVLFGLSPEAVFCCDSIFEPPQPLVFHGRLVIKRSGTATAADAFPARVSLKGRNASRSNMKSSAPTRTLFHQHVDTCGRSAALRNRVRRPGRSSTRKTILTRSFLQVQNVSG